jgi:hypothetical protein
MDACRLFWLRAHRGVFVKVARSLGVSPQAVRRVFFGQSTSARIERELRLIGAPIPDKPKRVQVEFPACSLDARLQAARSRLWR